MSEPLVLQSCPPGPRPAWLQACLDSVAGWSAARAYTYRCVGDELFDLVAPELREKTHNQPVIATDLARLRLLQQGLSGGAEAVVWLDADCLIFAPEVFELPAADHAVGRQVWVQADGGRGLRVYRQVHNAFLYARSGNSFLDFYADVAERLLRQNTGTMPPQFIGPKLLSALHNIVQLPVQESAGVLSPLVIESLLGCDPEPLRRLNAASAVPPAAVNLCRSSVLRGRLDDARMQAVVDRLLGQGWPARDGSEELP